MTQRFSEPVELVDEYGRVSARLGNTDGDMRLGGEGHDGDLRVHDRIGRTAIHLNGDAAKIQVGTAGNEGDIAVRDAEGRDVFVVSGHYATCYLGAEGNEGDLFLRDGRGRNVMRMDGESARLEVGHPDNPGHLRVHAGTIVVTDQFGNESVRILGPAGDLELTGADCAEEFDTATEAPPGSVMVITEQGALVPCSRAYDRAVAGVISGAGGFSPGVVLDRRRERTGRRPIALVGKVYVWVDADLAEVRLGDLLTTSATAGHAMKADDPGRAFGATIGKALASLSRGRSLVPMLVALQ